MTRAGPPAPEFVLRRAPLPDRPAHQYALFWGPREVGRGDYPWAVRLARTLSIPRVDIDHNGRHHRVDDGYEGWHLNARIVGRDSA